MRRVRVIGIGAGNPEHVTQQAIQALQRVDVFFAADKGEEKEELEKLRAEICARYIRGRSYRTVRFADPLRARGGDYRASVAAWHAERQAIYERLLRDELADGECGAFLAWGDPALYDSTLRILERIRERGAVALECEVIPGISSVQALAASHRLPLQRVGESLWITTGRKLAAGYPQGADSVVVMLDADCTFRRYAGQDLEIYWGAYLGSADEILVSGRLDDVMDDIERIRREARSAKGWIMDIYLLRPAGPR